MQRNRPKPKDGKWFDIKAAAEGPAQVYIYEEIDDWWGIGAKQFADELNAITASEIDLHINSVGGSVFEGNAIFNVIRSHKATVTVYIDSIAASIASVIALAGDKVVIARNARFMIHDPHALSYGRASDMRKTADILDKLRDDIAAVYVARTGMETEDVLAAMAEETWYSAEEAVDSGFADELGPELAIAAKVDAETARFYGFKRVPDDLVAEEPKQAVVQMKVELTPELSARLDQIEAKLDGSGDTAPTMDSKAVAQALRARFKEE